MNELALFAGAGGGILGGHLLGWRTVCAVEWEPYPASVLLARQNDGLLPPFPVWDDVRTFDGRPWRGIVDVVSGGFPCTDISAAGKGAGIEGAASGLWKEMARIVGEVRPSFVFVENSPLLVGRGLAVVLGDLAEMGFDARWCVLGANAVGAPHKRERIWIVAHAAGIGHRKRRMSGNVPDTDGEQEREMRTVTSCASQRSENMADTGLQRLQERNRIRSWRQETNPTAQAFIGWDAEPDVGRVAHGVAARVDRLKATGNGQVPQCAAAAWRMLSEGLT
jgi:DNA (cytosine-5)-methyltransferase 1